MPVRLARPWLILLLPLLLIACSGGGGSGDATLSGTAASGAPFMGTVQVVDANGTLSAQVSTDANGDFTLSLPNHPPFMLRVQASSGTATLYSVAFSGGRVNITPLTSLALVKHMGMDLGTLFSDWANRAGALSQNALRDTALVVKANLLSYFNAHGVDATDFSLFTSRFNADGSGFDAVLDDLQVTINGTQVELRERGSGQMIAYDDNADTGMLGGGGSGSGGGGSGGGGGGITPGSLTLATADRPNVAPCPSQTLLTDATAFADLKDALAQGTLAYLDVPYDANDPDIFKKKCGYAGYWDPADNTDEVMPGDVGLAAITIADLLAAGNAGICTDSFTNASFGNGEGFPSAGTYRKEIKASQGGVTYHLRLRAIASGSDAGMSFADAGISDVRGLDYQVNGTASSHDDVYSNVLANLMADGSHAPTAVVDVRETSGGPVIFSSRLELICATQN